MAHLSQKESAAKALSWLRIAEAGDLPDHAALLLARATLRSTAYVPKELQI